MAWILCCNLKNCGVNFLLCKSNCCFGMVLWKKTTAFIFVLLELSSRPSRRRKGCFRYFLGLNCSIWSQELRRKVYIDWMDTSLLLLCSFFFRQSTVRILLQMYYVTLQMILRFLFFLFKSKVLIIQKFEALQLHEYSWSCNALTNSLYRKIWFVSELCRRIQTPTPPSEPQTLFY